MKRYLMLTVYAVACLFSVSATAQEPPKPLAHFRFDGDAKDSSGHNTQVQLKNAKFKSDALYVNGKYDLEQRDALTCKIRTPSLEYDAFTVAIRFKAQEFEARKRNIITGGPSYRWFGLYRGDSGNLTVMLNGNRFKRELPVSLTTGQWYTIVCGVDLKAGNVRTHVNGEEVSTIKLPAGFKFAVATSRRKDSDKVWTFNNYANATVFHGLVDELVVYAELLSSDVAMALELGSTTQGNSKAEDDDAVNESQAGGIVAPDSAATTEQSDASMTPATFALSVAGKAEDQTWALGEIASALVRAGEFDRAIEVAEMIKPSNGSNLRELTLETVAYALVDSGEFNGAVKVALLNQEDYQKTDALNRIAIGMAKEGERQQVISALRQSYHIAMKIEEASKKSRALHEIGLASIEAGEKGPAAIILQKAADLARELGDAATKNYLLENLATALAKTGEVKQAVMMAHAIEDGSSRAQALHSIASTMFETGDKVEAVNILNQSLEAALKIDDQMIKDSVLQNITWVLAKAGESKKAAEVARKMEDPLLRSMALDSIETAVDDWKEVAMQQLQEMMMRSSANYQSRQMAEAVKSALEAAPENQDAFSEASGILMLASLQRKSGDKKEAAKSLDNACEVAQRINNPMQKANLFRRISSEYVETGEQQQSDAILARAVGAALEIEHASQRRSILLSFAMQLATEPLGETTEQLEARMRENVAMSSDSLRRLSPDSHRRMKTEFSPKENDLASQIMNGMPPAIVSSTASSPQKPMRSSPPRTRENSERSKAISGAGNTNVEISLSGSWVDSNGGQIEITQNGTQVTAVGMNAKTLKWWTTGTGTLSGKQIVMTHKKGSKVVDRVSGAVVADDRVNWQNGSHWKKTSTTDGKPKAMDLNEWLEKVKQSEFELNQILAAGKHEAKDNQLRPLTVWRSGSRNNRLPSTSIPESLQASANDLGCVLKIRSIRFKEFEAAFKEALEQKELPDILIFSNYQTLDEAQKIADGRLILAEKAFPFGPAPAVLFPSSNSHPSALALALRKPQPPEAFAEAQNNVSDQDAEELKRLCLASFKAFVSGDADSMSKLSDPLTAADVVGTSLSKTRPDMLSVEVSGISGNDRLAVVHINSRTTGKSDRDNLKTRNYGQLARGYLCRKSNHTWKILISSRGVDGLIDVVGKISKISTKADPTEINIKPPSIVSPEDGARASRFPRPDITWETCGTKDASYFVESQFSSRGPWSESWLKKIDGVNTKDETITIQAPFGVGSQPHRWRVWAISSGGQVALSDWRIINYRN